jgi:hypothetical protein
MESIPAASVIQPTRALRLIALRDSRTRHMLLKATITSLSAVRVMKERAEKATHRLRNFYFDITQFFVFLSESGKASLF